ncbi:MAG TPA: glycogen synthase GlgA [Candidatus Edwardsbacteria bacterium]|nr:glycogen synthase GlgA [Candidatus Edwardsbacteria bacterium]
MAGQPLKIAVIASEAVPFAKTGGLADVTGAMAKELARAGHDVVLVLPAHQRIDRLPLGLKPAGLRAELALGQERYAVGALESGFLPGVRSLFVDHPLFAARPELYGDAGGDYPDNGLRYGLFARAALELLKLAGFVPDIVHCHDWQTGLVPVLLRQDDAWQNTRSVFTIHNLAYQGIFNRQLLQTLGLPNSLFHIDGLEYYGQISFLKGGLFFADALTTVSPSYARQVLTPGYGCGLDGALRALQGKLSGILNGVDYGEWDPARDPYIPRYDPSKLHLKESVKRILCKRAGLEYRNGRPLAGIISRLASQKGWDLLSDALPGLMQQELDLVVLGAGDRPYQEMLQQAAARHRGRIGLKLGFDNELAHLIYGGADLFIMPSQYEPCGLGQMIALKYGTVPVVHATGGLADTITDFRTASETANGFSFAGYRAEELQQAVAGALAAYRVIPQWQALMKRAMACDFSWASSISRYLDLYRSLAGSDSPN